MRSYETTDRQTDRQRTGLPCLLQKDLTRTVDCVIIIGGFGLPLHDYMAVGDSCDRIKNKNTAKTC